MHQKKKNALFGNLYGLVLSANFVALSIVLGKYLAINIDQFIRISFENLPILAGGFFFGPIVGAIIGVSADLIGCVMVGYTINPIIALGAGSVGAIAGIIGLISSKNKVGASKAKRTLAAITATVGAHVIGSMIIKSIGMAVYYGHGIEVLWVRVPLYICIAAAESCILAILANSRLFIHEQEKIIGSRKRGADNDVR
jgi:ECF transporter S component (folate family)